MYIFTQQYAFQAVEKRGEEEDEEVSVMRRQSLVSSFLSSSITVYLQKCDSDERCDSEFRFHVESEMDRRGRWASCRWVYVSRPRRREPTEEWWTPGPRPPPAGGWCRRSRCWWWSGQSSERRFAAASPTPSVAAEEIRPGGVRESDISAWLWLKYRSDVLRGSSSPLEWWKKRWTLHVFFNWF